MKKVILSFVILAGSLSTFATPLQSSQVTISGIVLQDEFTEIKKEALPAAVTNALKAKHADAVIKKVFVNAEKHYKLEISVGDSKETLLCEENGKWIQ